MTDFDLYMNDEDILSLVASDPTAHEGGPSEIWEKLSCGRQYHLNRQFPEDSLAENCTRRNTGSIAHKLIEYYHRGAKPEDFFTRHADNGQLQKSLDVAWLIAEQYMGQYAADFWGKLVAAEVKPGGRPGRLDAVFDVDEAAIGRIEERFALHMNGAGLYVWDLKTAGQKDAHFSTRYEWGPACYMYVNSALQEWPTVRGMLFFQAVPHQTKTKGDWVEFYAAHYNVEGQTSQTAHMRYNHMCADAHNNTLGAGKCNPAACYYHGGACRHRLSGACEGI